MPLAALVGALYFMVSGGPYGLEELAQKIGFAEGIGVLVAVPIVWSLPTALMVGELAAAIPEEGGYYTWVKRALGPFWGFQEAWLSLAASVFDIAIYPTLFVLYLTRLAPSVSTWALPVGVLVIAAGAAWNLAGAFAVGEGSAIMTALLLGPFAILSVVAVAAHPALATAPAPASPPTPHDLAGGVLVAMWNYMGWDNASTIAGEVEHPQRTYPVGVLLAVALVALAYVIPFVAMLVAGVDPAAWDPGAWVDAARLYGGQALAIALVVGGMISAFGMFNALCLSYSRLPAVLAEEGYLPPILARRLPRTGVPWASVIACSVAWTLSLGLSFERLVSMDILLYGTSLILEFVALVVLRIREPGLPRPFKVPGGLPVAIALGIGPLVLLGVALSKNADEELAGINALLFGLGIMAAGVVAYPAARAYAAKRRAGEHVATR
jgi:amino acid transporter